MTGLELLVVAVIMAVVSAAISALTIALAPKPDIEDALPSSLGDFGFPTNLESRYIPVVWGSTRISGPNVIWYGDFRTTNIRRDGNNVGFDYYLGIDMALCWGELDSITAIQLDDEFLIKAGEERTHTGGVVPAAGFLKPTFGQRTISVRDLNFTGGSLKGGGIEGDISFYYGTQNQPRSEYLARVLTESGETETLASGEVVPRASLLPSYKGVARMIWEGGLLTERPTAPQFQVHVQRFPTTLTTAFTKIRDNGTTADANPIHVIYEILTDVNWGLAIDPSLINRDSFIAAAKKCFEEENGFSRTIDSPKQAFGVIQNISDQVNGFLFQNEDGLFEYTLNRKTYEETTNAILDYDGNPVGGTTYTTDAIFNTADAAADARFGDDALWDALEVGDQIFVTNVTEGSGLKPCVVTSKSSIATKFVFFASTTGEDLGADATFIGGSIVATVQKGFDTVPILTPASIIKVKAADRQSWDQTFNTVHLKYLDRTQEFKETVANAVDSGNMAIRRGKKSIKQVDMQGIRHAGTAATVAQRFLKSYSYPLTTLSLEVSRDLSYLRPGSILEVNHPDFGLFDFYMRVLEVGLPQDSSGNVVVKGIRDVFDEPTSSIQVGGSASLEVTVTTGVEVPSSLGLTGLPEFLHLQQGLSASEVNTWHLIGAPNTTTTSAQAFQLNNGLYTPVSGVESLPPSGKVVGNTSDLWRNRSQEVQRPFPPVTEYDRNSSSLGGVPSAIGFSPGGPYSYSPGPYTNPIRHNTNQSPNMVEGFSNGAMMGNLRYISFGLKYDYIRAMGDILVRDLTVAQGELEVTNVTEAQIKNLGFALAIVRPAWANGDTRYEEIIAFTSATREVISHVLYGTGGAGDLGAWVVANGIPEENALETYESFSLLSLSGVYRGLLDTGIQVLNSDSEILFLSQSDPLYDLVGQNINSINAQTYRYGIDSPGGRLAPEDNTDQIVSANELERRRRPLPPTLLNINNDTPDQLWGYNNYSSNLYTEYTVKDVGTSTMDLRWSTHNHAVNPSVIKLYSEPDAVDTSERLFVSLDLIDDDRIEITTVADRPDANERNRHLLARLKEGWMPTNPPLRGGTEYTEGVDRDTLGFAASTSFIGSQNPNNAEVVDLTARFAAMANGSRPELTSGEVYFVEVSVQSYSTTDSLLSRGAQRFGVKFTATADVTN